MGPCLSTDKCFYRQEFMTQRQVYISFLEVWSHTFSGTQARMQQPFEPGRLSGFVVLEPAVERP